MSCIKAQVKVQEQLARLHKPKLPLRPGSQDQGGSGHRVCVLGVKRNRSNNQKKASKLGSLCKVSTKLLESRRHSSQFRSAGAWTMLKKMKTLKKLVVVK